MAMFPDLPSFWQGVGVHVEYLNHLVKIPAVQISDDCREGFDDELYKDLVDHLFIYDR